MSNFRETCEDVVAQLEAITEHLSDATPSRL